MRYTETFLIYAEAANLAWGPDVDGGGNGFTAREVIAQIRSTAGITTDDYLASLTTPAEMDALIRNERRIELSFEGSRFWDIRRWNDIDIMKAPVMGTADGGLTTIEVEPRRYSDYFDNSLDKEHKFHIGIAIGGLYGENTKNWTVDYVVDNSLITDFLVNGNNDTLLALPANYYTMTPEGSTTIPSGKFQGQADSF